MLGPLVSSEEPAIQELVTITGNVTDYQGSIDSKYAALLHSVAKYMWLYVTPILIIAGLIGNSLSAQLSAWTLVLITLEKLVPVKWPFIANSVCSRKKMILAWLFIFTLLLLGKHPV